VALGFTIVFNASGAINFAQGEFVMVGGMSAATLWRPAFRCRRHPAGDRPRRSWSRC
jgi:branched-subunit amino acid ABC-type transport system permease component